MSPHRRHVYGTRRPSARDRNFLPEPTFMIAPTVQSKTGLASAPVEAPPRRKLLFASVHSILDFSNGASVATLDVLQGLTTLGFECQAFCTSKLDIHKEVNFEKIISDLHEPHQVRQSVCGTDRARVLYTRRHQVPITFMHLETTRHIQQTREEIRTVLQFFLKFLEIYRPDVMLTYGGDPITLGMIALAKARGIPVVFALHNFEYVHQQPFSQVDYCIVPSQFVRGIIGTRSAWTARRCPIRSTGTVCRVDSRDARFVTFINPALNKGVCPFVRIAQELGRRRPDIPLLVVESRGTKENLAACGLDPSASVNIQIMPNTTDPRRFWRLTKLLLMPSLWWESQGLVAVEAMINGIPVVGSDRGAIPETLGDGGVALNLPERLTPVSLILPTAEEVEPWVEAIIRLWDDRALYEEQSREGQNTGPALASRPHQTALRRVFPQGPSPIRTAIGPNNGRPLAGRARLGSSAAGGSARVFPCRRGPGRSCFSLFRAPAMTQCQPWRLIAEKPLYQAADEFPSFGVAGFDAILLEEVPKRVVDPISWLSRLRGLLALGGFFALASEHDVQHTFLNHGKHGKHGKNAN